ncbi:MAG: alcohol dehydrogenase catalytic domain-containing protein, partial [Gammaproteobacteria bacterium]|nr:alcohol dehydrogenase catalytic domain-containing protein [Gammaproteobacteria bacterium]
GTDLFKLDTGAAAPGTVLGHELVGEVAALGDGVSGFRDGDRVAVPHHVACGNCALCRRGATTMCETFKENLLTPGGFAEHVTVQARATACAARAL